MTASGGVWVPFVDDELSCPFGYLFARFRAEYGIADTATEEEAREILMAAGRVDHEGKPVIDEAKLV